MAFRRRNHYERYESTHRSNSRPYEGRETLKQDSRERQTKLSSGFVTIGTESSTSSHNIIQHRINTRSSTIKQTLRRIHFGMFVLRDIRSSTE